MIKMKQAVHFGAGNIGRGFIGALFSQSGYHVTFVDVADRIINQLNEEKQYQVILATDQQETMTIGNVSGLNNMSQESEVIEAIKQATYLTTAIGPNILPRIAPLMLMLIYLFREVETYLFPEAVPLFLILLR
jgi:mannitol-1-phosphate 5-dehydrogenase